MYTKDQIYQLINLLSRQLEETLLTDYLKERLMCTLRTNLLINKSIVQATRRATVDGLPEGGVIVYTKDLSIN